MEVQPLTKVLNEIIHKVNSTCEQIRHIQCNTVSKDELESLQKQIEILSLQVAKNSNVANSQLLYVPQRTPNMKNANESLHA